MQYDFLPGGALEVERGDEILSGVVELSYLADIKVEKRFAVHPMHRVTTLRPSRIGRVPVVELTEYRPCFAVASKIHQERHIRSARSVGLRTVQIHH